MDRAASEARLSNHEIRAVERLPRLAKLGVDRTTLSKVLNGRAAISPAMALRIERWLGRDRGGAAEVWLAQQTAFDLWQARAALKKTKALARIRSASHQAA